MGWGGEMGRVGRGEVGGERGRWEGVGSTKRKVDKCA